MSIQRTKSEEHTKRKDLQRIYEHADVILNANLHCLMLSCVRPSSCAHALEPSCIVLQQDSVHSPDTKASLRVKCASLCNFHTTWI